MDKGTEGIFVRFEPFWRLCAEGTRYRLPHTHAPRPLRGMVTANSGPFGCVIAAWHARRWGPRKPLIAAWEARGL
jgi:hypothetical protein